MRAIYYHSVLDGPADGIRAANAVTVDQLRAHAEELARNWQVLSLDEVSGHLQARRPLPERAVHVSFDDGFRNNLLAAEIFDAAKVPWTLFAVADAVLDGYRPWYVRLADALDAQGPSGPTERGVQGGETGQAFRVKEQVKARVMKAPARSHCAVLEEALAEAGLAEPAETAWPFLTGSELSDLARRGVEIGNHSATHPNLVACDDEELDREVNGSRARLEQAVGRPVRFFSYPDGRFDRRVLRVTGAAHQAAMATWTPRAPLAALRIRRYSVGPTVDDLRAVLAPGYPARYRRMALKWALRRRLRQVRAVR